VAPRESDELTHGPRHAAGEIARMDLHDLAALLAGDDATRLEMSCPTEPYRLDGRGRYTPIGSFWNAGVVSTKLQARKEARC
jgi:hypothetical protein